MSNDDPYQILGVSRDASDDQIKKAFRTLARRYHPDRNPNDKNAESRFKKVQSAYDQIGTAKARKEYEKSQMFGGGFGGGNMNDIFSQMFGGGGFSNSFSRGGGQPFGQRGASPSSNTQKGQDATGFLELSVDEAEAGGKFVFEFTKLVPGSHGSISKKPMKIRVNVKSQSKHGDKLTLKGQGHGHPDGVPGDLIIQIRIDPGQGCRWEQGRIVQYVEIQYSTLVLGGKVNIQLPNGMKARVTIPENSLIGDRFRINEYDIELGLLSNEALTDEQKNLLNKLHDVGL